MENKKFTHLGKVVMVINPFQQFIYMPMLENLLNFLMTPALSTTGHLIS